MKNKKKKIILVLLIVICIILLLITGIFYIRYLKTKKPKDNSVNNSVDFTIKENKAEKLPYKNQVENISIERIEVYNVDKEYFIVLMLANNGDNNQIDKHLQLNIVNKVGDVIFKTGTVKDVLPKGNADHVYFKITKEIKNMIEKGNEIDCIELLEEK